MTHCKASVDLRSFASEGAHLQLVLLRNLGLGERAGTRAARRAAGARGEDPGEHLPAVCRVASLA